MKLNDIINELDRTDFMLNAINQNIWLLSDTNQMLLSESDIQLILSLMAKNLQNELENLRELIGYLKVCPYSGVVQI